LRSDQEIIESARRTIEIEAKAIMALTEDLNSGFSEAVKSIFQSKGRVIITGIGKSANIANKIVATFNSTGTPAIFMHAADAIHGDLGIVQKDDVVIAISNSGDTPEIKVLVPLVKNLGSALLALTGNGNSYLGQRADHVLLARVEQEACPNNLAPTSSTTAQLVIGDALAVALLEMREFDERDFARYHPGGSLGKRLYLRVSDLFGQNERPTIGPEASFREVILSISGSRLGMTTVLENEKVLGVITDGDIRRCLEQNEEIGSIRAQDIMSTKPKSVGPGVRAAEALEILEKNQITTLLVMEGDEYLGVIHLHDIVKEGII
jgi:arabinose-5-phosphate isomerase